MGNLLLLTWIKRVNVIPASSLLLLPTISSQSSGSIDSSVNILLCQSHPLAFIFPAPAPATHTQTTALSFLLDLPISHLFPACPSLKMLKSQVRPCSSSAPTLPPLSSELNANATIYQPLGNSCLSLQVLGT